MCGMGDEQAPRRDPEAEKVERLKRAMYSRSISPKLKERPRRVLQLGPEPVPEEWAPEEASTPRVLKAPRFIGATRSALRLFLGAAILFFVGAVGFFGFYFVFGGGSSAVSPGNIDIVVSGPSRIPSGAPSELQVSVVNRNQAPLEYADLVIRYPAGTRSSADLETELPVQRISLGTIPSGARRQGTVSAVFNGIEGVRSSAKIELEYRLGGSSAIFTASNEYSFVYASSPITVAVVANAETISGQPIDLSVTVASNADAPQKDVVLNAEYPFGFSLQSADPTPANASAKDVWELGDLAPGQKKTISIRGVLIGESGDKRVFRFIAGTREDPKSQKVSHVLTDYAHTMLVSRPFLGMNIVVNKDAGDASPVVGVGETVNVSIQYQNNLGSAITDAVIVARLSGVSVDGSTMRSSDGFYRSADNVVYWDKTTTNGALASLAPGERGTVGFSFQVPKSEELEGVRNPRLDISVNASGRRVSETGVPQTLQSTETQSIRLASDLQLAVQGLYYGNPFGSSGPMPPAADRETTYGIAFSVTNTTNEVTSGRVTAHLPPYVRWVGIYGPPEESVTFNPSDSSMEWELGTIPAGTGVGGANARQIVVVLGLTPSTSQIGQQPEILSDITLTAKDSVGKSVSKTAPDITTNIVGDTGFSAANATVVK